MGNRTTVNVSEETWKRLTMRRGPGDTYDDVIQELLDIADEHETDDQED